MHAHGEDCVDQSKTRSARGSSKNRRRPHESRSSPRYSEDTDRLASGRTRRFELSLRLQLAREGRKSGAPVARKRVELRENQRARSHLRATLSRFCASVFRSHFQVRRKEKNDAYGRTSRFEHQTTCAWGYKFYFRYKKDREILLA